MSAHELMLGLHKKSGTRPLSIYPGLCPGLISANFSHPSGTHVEFSAAGEDVPQGA